MLPERMKATGRVKAPQQQEAADGLNPALDPEKRRHRGPSRMARSPGMARSPDGEKRGRGLGSSIDDTTAIKLAEMRRRIDCHAR